jgi:hypothetical protein
MVPGNDSAHGTSHPRWLSRVLGSLVILFLAIPWFAR